MTQTQADTKIIQKQQALQTYFKAQTLTELGLDGVSLSVCLHYQDTRLPKQGLAAILGKLPLPMTNSRPVAMDIDLGCVLFDQSYQPLDLIWYARLRNDNESIRHSGDALIGSRNFEESLIHQEQIRLRPDEIEKQVYHIAFVVSSYRNQDLNLANKGSLQFLDNENHSAHSLELASLPKNCQTLLAWVLSRYDQDWQLQAPMLPLNTTRQSHKRLDLLANQIGHKLLEASSRW